MGRQERPLDPEAGLVQRFAFELRKLRQEAGGLTYRAMAQRTCFTVSTLSRAAAGEQLPSLPVALAYVQACGGEVEEWRERWEQVAEAQAALPCADEDAESPYRGLARFEPADRERFFGRSPLIADVHDLVRRERVTAVVGPSGSGKSSLLRAGLIPALQDEASPGQRLAGLRILTPGAHPMHHAHLLTPQGGEDADGDTVVIIDQFEETFTLCPDAAERAAFLDLLLTARDPDSRLRVVIAVRADFFGRCAEHRALADALRHTTLLVGPMSPAELREAIVKPAATAGLNVERALTARIIDEVVGEPGGLPLMSHALLETWRRRKGRALTTAAYEAAGGLHSAIAHTAEAAYTQLTPDQADLSRRILLRLITPGEGAQDTRRPVDRTELDTGTPADTAAVLERLACARLITLDNGVVDLAHEALITAWPRLRGWIDQDREWLRLHRQLTEAARTWQDLDRDPGALYRGTRLAAAEEQMAQPERRADLTGLERSFLDASHRAQQATIRRTRRLNTILVGALILALIATGLAFWQRQTALTQRQAALTAQQQSLSRQLAAQSDTLLDANPDLASLLAVAAYRTSPTAEATTSLYKAADLPLQHRLTGHKDAVSSVAFSPDGSTLATSSDDGTVRLWDTRTGHTRQTLTGLGARVFSVVFSPDGRTLATSSDDHIVRLWDTRTGHTRKTLTGHKSFVRRVAFSPDGSTLATSSDDGTVRLWDTRTGHTRKTLIIGMGGGVDSVAFSPDGHTLATTDTVSPGSRKGKVRLWDTRTGHLRKTLTGHKDAVSSVAFSPDGSTLATGSDDGTVRLWDTRTGHTRQTLTGLGARVFSVVFSPDGRTLATSSGIHGGEQLNARVRLWDTRTGHTRKTLTGLGFGVAWVVFSPDGRTLATASGDSTLQLRDTRTGHLRKTLTGHTLAVSSMVFSPDGRTLATGSYDRTVRLSDTRTSRLRKTLIGMGGGVDSVAFSPDGHTLATTDTVSPGSRKGKVRLWDTRTSRLRKTLIGMGGGVDSVAFSPDGHTLATSGMSRTVQLWDTRTGHLRKTLTGPPWHSSTHSSVLFSPDGRTLASAGHDHVVHLWDTRTGHLRKTLTGHKDSNVSSVAFSPDGRTLATSVGNRTVRLWDTRTGHLRKTLTSYKGLVRGVAFSPDGRTLATGSADDAVRLWDTRTGHLRKTLTGHKSFVSSVAFSPDGRTLATGSVDRTVRLWDVKMPDQATAITKICKAVDRDLTAKEQAAYLVGQSSSPVCPSQHSARGSRDRK